MALSELEKKLAALEFEQERQQNQVNTLSVEMTDVKLVENVKVDKRPQHGYIIRLVFGDKSPVSEWSDETNGWRTKGLGSRYNSKQDAEKKFSLLKKKWPSYPLKLIQV